MGNPTAKESLLDKVIEAGNLGPTGGVYSPSPVHVQPTTLDLQAAQTFANSARQAAQYGLVPYVAGKAVAHFVKGSKKPVDILDTPIKPVYYPDAALDNLRKQGFDVSMLPAEPRATHSEWEALVHPVELTEGLLQPVTDIAKTVYELAKEPFAENLSVKERALTAGYNVAALAYNLSLKPIVEAFAKTRDPNDPYAHINIAQGLWNTAEEMLPFHELMSLYTGRNLETKAPLTPKEWGATLSSGIMKTLFLKEVVGRGVSAMRQKFYEDIHPHPIDVPASKAFLEKNAEAAKAIEEGEKAGEELARGSTLDEPIDLDTLTPKVRAIAEKVKGVTGEPPTVKDFVDALKTSGIELENIQELTAGQTYKLLTTVNDSLNELYRTNPDKFNEVLFDAAVSRAKREATLQAAGKPGASLKTNVYADLIRAEAVGPSAIAQIFKTKVLDQGMSPEAVAQQAQAVATLLEKTASESGARLNAISKATVDALEPVLANNPEALEAIHGLRDALRTRYAYLGPFEKANYFYRRYALKWMRGGAIGQLATTMRNIQSQGGGYIATTVEDFIADSRIWAHSMKNLVLRGMKPVSPAEAYHQTVFDVINAIHHIHAASIKGFGLARYTLAKIGRKTGDNTYEYIPKDPANFKPLFNVYDEIMKAMPPDFEARLRQTYSSEIALGDVTSKAYWKYFGNKIVELQKNPTLSSRQAIARQAATVLDTMVDVASLGNMTQEIFFRKMFFVRALEKHTRERGYLGIRDFAEALKDGRADTHTTMIGGFKSAEDAAAKLKQLRDAEVPKMAREKALALAQSFKRKMKNPKALGQRVLNTQQKFTDLWTKHIDESLRLLDEGVEPNEALGGLPDVLAKKLGGEVESDMTSLAYARDSSLRNTFALTPPDYTLAGHVLQAYKVLPLAGLGPYFPRFLANAWGWINRRNPFAHSDFAKTRLGEELDAMVEKGTTRGLSRRALDEWSRHVNGVIMLSAAKFIQGTSYAGPHFYQIWTGTKDADGNKNYWDVRPLQPFSTYMFLAKAFDLAGRGESLKGKISAADAADALIGVRRLQDQVAFSFTDIMRQISSDNLDSFWRSVKRIAGQPLGMPFVWLQGFMDLMAGDGFGETYAKVRDTQERELFGPLLNETVPQALPAQYDPYLGGPLVGKQEIAMGSKNLFSLGGRFRQMSGVSLQKVSPLEDYFTHLGISTGDLLGHYKSQLANEGVRRWMGTMLGHRLANGETVNAMLARTLRTALRSTPDPLARKFIIKQIIAPLRKQAITFAAMEEPKVWAKEGSTFVKGAPTTEIQEMMQFWLAKHLPSQGVSKEDILKTLGFEK